MTTKAKTPTRVKLELNDDNRVFSFSNPLSIEKASGDAKGANQRQFSGVGYTGDIIPNHWYFGNVIFDLSTINPPKGSMPALVDHDSGQIAGFINEFNVDPSKGIQVKGPLIAAQGYLGQYIADGSDAGFPWQMSVRINPGSIEEIQQGTSLNVNGRVVDGPATVFRNSDILEVSFCANGWDTGTSAAAMSRQRAGYKEPSPSLPSNKDTPMTPEEQARLDALTAENATLKAGNAKLSTDLETLNKQFANQAAAKRLDDIKNLFAKTKREFKADSDEVKELLGLDETAFSIAAKYMQPTQSSQSADPKLFQNVAGAGREHTADQGQGQGATEGTVVENGAARPTFGLVKLAQERAAKAAPKAA